MIRTVLAAARTISAVIFLVAFVPPAAIIAFPWTLISKDVRLLYSVGMGLSHLAARIAGAKIKLLGLEKLDPQGTYIFMSNHVSNLDPPVLVPFIPRRTSVLAKKELWRIPILSKALDLAEIVPVDRSSREAALRSIRRAGEVMRHGINMTIYPEGTRSRDGRLLPFKKGPFHLAMETGYSVVPVTILGTYEMMPKGSWIARSGTASVVFHAPVGPQQFASREELMQVVWEKINSALPEERRQLFSNKK
jgi:1-acyl-sn-glycerol-3-phosphate acyltransferase